MCGPSGPGGGCGIYAFVKAGRFVRVAGMDESPNNQGALCAKAHAAPQWVYSKDRLTHPLRRIGKKGEGKFEKITWEEAVAHIAEVLTKQKETYGPESLAILAPARRSYSDYLQRFLVAHGSPNYGHSGICAMQRAFAFMYTVGDWVMPDYPRSDMVILWGRQPIYSGPVAPPARAFLAAKLRGATIIAIKPSVEPDAGMADIWMPVRHAQPCARRTLSPKAEPTAGSSWIKPCAPAAEPAPMPAPSASPSSATMTSCKNAICASINPCPEPIPPVWTPARARL